LRVIFGSVLSKLYVISLLCFLPIMPLLASLVFWRRRFVIQYVHTLKRCVIHVRALAEGPALHYFSEVAGQASGVPGEIRGTCTQCGNCCMNHRCLFLEPLGENKFGCAIYDSPWRRFSNCGSFPLNQHDIDRYACPSYFVAHDKPINCHRTSAHAPHLLPAPDRAIYFDDCR